MEWSASRNGTLIMHTRSIGPPSPLLVLWHNAKIRLPTPSLSDPEAFSVGAVFRRRGFHGGVAGAEEDCRSLSGSSVVNFHLELPHRKRTGCISQGFMPSGAAAPHDVLELHGRVCRKPETACRAGRVLFLHKYISYDPFYRPLNDPISAHRIK